MRSLTIDTGDVPVALSLITDVDATEPRIDSRMVTSTDDTQLTIANDDASSRVTLGGSGSGLFRFSRNGEIKVILPPDVARKLKVTVNQRAGSLSTDADLDQLVARTDSGAVTLGGSARRVDVSVRHGDISTSTRMAVTESITEQKPNPAASRWSSVRRHALLKQAPSGDVTVWVPGPGPYRVRAQSGRPLARRW